jgi:hypothetical protein
MRLLSAQIYPHGYPTVFSSGGNDVAPRITGSLESGSAFGKSLLGKVLNHQPALLTRPDVLGKEGSVDFMI